MPRYWGDNHFAHLADQIVIKLVHRVPFRESSSLRMRDCAKLSRKPCKVPDLRLKPWRSLLLQKVFQRHSIQFEPLSGVRTHLNSPRKRSWFKYLTSSWKNWLRLATCWPLASTMITHLMELAWLVVEPNSKTQEQLTNPCGGTISWKS